MNIVLFIVALLVMLIGLVGIILPILPGVPFIFAGALGYALITHFEAITLMTIIWFAVLAAVSLLLDWLPSVWGVKKMGGSSLGILGSLAGMIIGMFSGGIIGLIIGAFIGAFLGELLTGKNSQAAFKAGLGSFIGFLAGSVLKFALGVIMIGIFIWQVVF